ncbi:uncharacterized protein LOC135469263 [Liolophura sinensis]|uniref:uncharacterized protein LOC135469263 n=1 Tax=Liolophura sinensis TaxID=3198878 RepID=UPI00315806A8
MAWRALLSSLLLANVLLPVVSQGGGDTPAEALQLKSALTPSPILTPSTLVIHPAGHQHARRRHHPHRRRHRFRGRARGRYRPPNGSHPGAPRGKLEENHFPSLPGYLTEVELGPEDGGMWGGPDIQPEDMGEDTGSAIPPNPSDLGHIGKIDGDKLTRGGGLPRSSASQEPVHRTGPRRNKDGVLYRDQGHWPRTRVNKPRKASPGRPKLTSEKAGNLTGVPLYDHPLYDLLHNKEFVANASESLASLKELQKNRLNKIYDVYMNNSMELLMLETKLHRIGTEMMLNKDTHAELEETLERYRYLMNSMRIDASKEIQSCLKDIHFQSDQVMEDIQKDVNKTSEFKHFVADQLEEVCEYLKTDEKMTIHDLQEGLVQKDEEIARLQQQIYDLKKENSHLRVESEGFHTLTKALSSLQHDSERTQETLQIMEKQLSSVKKVVSTIGYPYQQVTFEWKLYPFDYDTTWNGCRGPQYVQLSGYDFGHGKYVGVVLCSPSKYKIFLSDDLQKKFLNIGDRTGNGEDHCEFVRSYRKARFVSDHVGPTTEIDGFGRAQWGVRPYRRKIGLSHGYRSPKWYDCGIAIP